MNKIITKILIAIMLCSILVAVSISTLSMLHASKILRQEAYDKLRYVSGNYANKFSIKLKNIEGTVDTLESVVTSSFDSNQFVVNQSYQSGYMKRIDDMLQKVADNSIGIQGIYIIINPELTGQVFESWFVNNGKGHFIYQEPEDISMFSPANQDMAWYYEPINKKKGVWIPPYADATINVKMISYTKAIFNEGLLIGVAGIDIAFKDIEKTIGDMKLYESGYSFLLNKDLTILLHPSLETGTYLPNIKNEDLNHVAASMEKNESDAIEYIYKNEEKILGFSKLSNGWILAVSAVTDDILRPIEHLKNSIKIRIVFLLIITGIIGLLISKSITAPINRLRDMAALISQGQQDIPLDLNSDNEIGELSKSIHTMTQKLIASHKELKESEEKFKALADTSPLAIYMSEGIQQKARYINPAFIKLFGYTIGEVPTVEHWWPLAYPDPSYRRQVAGEWQKKVEYAIEKQSKIEPMEAVVTCKDGSKKDILWEFITIGKLNYACGLNLTERKQQEEEREKLINELKEAIENIKTLKGLVPICSSCKKIRDDKGYWNILESYIQKHSDAKFSHGMCPECSEKFYGDEDWYIKMKKKKGSNLS